MENSDWEEAGPEDLGGDRPGDGAEESQQSLTPKVLELMQKISEYGYLTMQEVQFIFGNKTWAYKVVKGLRSQGFIADHDTLMSPRTAHYLTPKGYRILGKFGRLKVGIRFKPERYSIFIFWHRMACAKVGLLLEKHPLVHEFLPESRLFKLQKDKLDKLCDGEFWYRVPGHKQSERVGLEIELTLKSKQRLDETFQELARREDLDQVWWICADDNIRRGMRREVMRRYLPPSQRHFFALMREFLAAKGKAELMEPNGALLSIDPKKPTLLPRPPEPPPPPPPPKPAPVAQAEAHKPPEPAPPEEPALSLGWTLLAWLGSVAFRLLKWSWRWLKDSWSLYRNYDDSWGLEFNRWPHVCALGALAIAVACYRLWPAARQLLEPPTPARHRIVRKAERKPEPVWVERKLEEVWLSTNGFSARWVQFWSQGLHHQLRIYLCASPAHADVTAVVLYDSRGRRRSRLEKGPLVIAPGCVPVDLFFDGTLDLQGFVLKVEAERFGDFTGRDRLEIPIRLK